MTLAQIEQRRNAGRKGGMATKAKYGVEYLRQVGRAGGHKGGRPTFWQSLQRAREHGRQAADPAFERGTG